MTLSTGESCGGVLWEYVVLCTKSSTFSVGIGLRQGCPLSPILFVIFMDRIARRSRGVESVRFGDLRVASLLFADDVVLLATSDRELQHALGWFAAECEAVGMRVSTSNSEAMVLCRKTVECSLRVGSELLPQAKVFKLGGSGSCSRVRVKWSGRWTDRLVWRLQ